MRASECSPSWIHGTPGQVPGAGVCAACSTASTGTSRRAFAFRQTNWELQQYLPHFNGSRVVALRAAAVVSFPKAASCRSCLPARARRQRRPPRLRAIPLPRQPLGLSRCGAPLARVEHLRHGRLHRCRQGRTLTRRWTPRISSTAAASGCVFGCALRSSPASILPGRGKVFARCGPSATSSRPGGRAMAIRRLCLAIGILVVMARATTLAQAFHPDDPLRQEGDPAPSSRSSDGP